MPTIAEDIIAVSRRAMRRQLLTVDSLPAADAQQWEGLLREFTPPSGTPWMRETMMRQPGPPHRVSIGTQCRIRNRGIYQVDLFFPSDANDLVAEIEACGGDIRTAFPFSLVLDEDGQQVTCEGCGLSGITKDTETGTPLLHLTAQIPWYADTFNPI